MLDNLPPLDVITGIRAATWVAFFLVAYSVWSGLRAIRGSRELPYFRLRRQRLLQGWRALFLSIVFAGVGLLLFGFGEPTANRFLPLTVTPSQTPTITISPTITLTPTITLSPTISPTSALSPTAQLPQAIEALFESTVTPNPDTVFSELVFSQSLDSLFRPLEPAEEFSNPVGTLFASFTYDGMALGSQWTAAWYRGDELVHFETQAWLDGTGGAGFSEWAASAEEWLPGEYRVIIFVGTEWKQVGAFAIAGAPITSTPTISSTPLPTNTSTVTSTSVIQSTPTRTSTITPYPTLTRTVKPTPYPTQTRTATQPSPTPYPTLTRTATPTP